MDVVLDVCDAFLFDRLYAMLLPASKFDSARASTQHMATTTFSSMREMPTPYQPASQYLRIEPSLYAYMSIWQRDNIFRQALSLYLITW